MSYGLIIGFVLAIVLCFGIYNIISWVLNLRTVVQTNEVHIVQGNNAAIPGNENLYFEKKTELANEYRINYLKSKIQFYKAQL